MTLILHNVYERLKTNALEITGFSTAAVATPLSMQELLNTALNALVVAVISGFIGGFIAHYTKKLISKLKL